MLACTRRLFALAERARQGSGWKEDITDESCLLSGKCVGLLGLGNIGSRVCRMVRTFGAHVCYYDPFRATAQKEEELGVTFAAFDEVVARADILSLHLPLNESTYHIIGKETFQTMKKKRRPGQHSPRRNRGYAGAGGGTCRRGDLGSGIGYCGGRAAPGGSSAVCHGEGDCTAARRGQQQGSECRYG